MSDRLLFAWSVGILFALLFQRAVGAVQMQEFADQDVEVLDVLFERTHARLVPRNVKADVELVVRGLRRLLPWATRCGALATLHLELLLGLAKLALRVGLNEWGFRRASTLPQQARRRQIEFGQEGIDQDAENQHPKKRRENKASQKDASPQSRPALVVGIEENGSCSIRAQIRSGSQCPPIREPSGV